MAALHTGGVLCAGRWYLRYSLSYRDSQELLIERGFEIDHTIVWQWVQRYTPELEERTRPHLKPTNKSWRVDESYVRIKGRWFYLYKAIDSVGGTIDFYLSVFRSAEAAKALFAKARADPSHPAAAGDEHGPSLVLSTSDSRIQGVLRKRCRHGPVQYLNILEQDHCAIKRRGPCQAAFSSVQLRTEAIQGYETMHKIPRDQVPRVKNGDIRVQNRFIDQVFGLAA